tara:strand:- start:6573 stop:6911 length:339 start_codon:yes stop_codon:yes gene_type:complete
MNREEKAVKDGLKQVIEHMNKHEKVADLNRGFNVGVGQGKVWALALALIASLITCAIVVTATLITVGEVDGRSQAQNQYLLQQQKIIIDQMALMDVEIQAAIKKLENEVNKK